MTDPNLWNQLLIWPIVNILVAFYKLFEWLRVPGVMGFAIIGMTAFIRLLLYPLMQAQMKSAKKMSNLKPHLDALNAKHKDDKPKLQQAQLALYKEHGVNPAAGCLPLLVQMPILIALYNVFYQVLGNGNLETLVTQLNQVLYVPAMKLTSLDLTFFGINLGLKPEAWQTQGWWLLSVPVITGLLQFWQSKLMMPTVANTTNKQILPISNTTNEKMKPSSAKASAGKPEEKKEDMMGDMQKQMMMITPIMFGFFAFQFPLGLSLYWNVFGLFGIMQQLAVNKENKG
ncbi:MAG: YidC/Oxa1 family membrane protein insertase [Candidatus Gottesmanbacteria bacterium]|nr:YidC/Oxa1 family membrane protein insertase [Candidatus Gottesmanbacteria bacterium]